jgi:hypothetical protein
MTIPTNRRPLGYWVEAVARLLASSLEPPLAAAGIDRSGWRTLTVLERGPATEAEMTAAMPLDEAEAARPLPRLAGLGWVEEADGRWRLTDAGRVAHDDILRAVSEVRRTAIDGISPDDFATTIQTLARVAGNLAAG